MVITLTLWSYRYYRFINHWTEVHIGNPSSIQSISYYPSLRCLSSCLLCQRRSVFSQGFSKGLGDNNWKLLVCHLWVPTTFLRCIWLTWEWEGWLPTELRTRKCVNQLNYSYSSVKKNSHLLACPQPYSKIVGNPTSGLWNPLLVWNTVFDSSNQIWNSSDLIQPLTLSGD